MNGVRSDSKSVTAFRVTKASTAASTGGRTSRSVSAIGGAWGDAEAIPTARSYLASATRRERLGTVRADFGYPYDGGTVAPELVNHTNSSRHPCGREHVARLIRCVTRGR